MHSGILRVALLVAVVGMMLAGACSAQWALPQDRYEGYFARVGMAFPIGDDVGDDDSVMVGFGWYGPVGTAINEAAVFGATVDWTTIERWDGKDVDLFPVMFKYGQHVEIGAVDLFGHIGIGVLYADDHLPEMDLDNGLNFGWDAGVDLELTRRLQLGLRFVAGDKPADNGMFVGSLAIRF